MPTETALIEAMREVIRAVLTRMEVKGENHNSSVVMELMRFLGGWLVREGVPATSQVAVLQLLTASLREPAEWRVPRKAGGCRLRVMAASRVPARMPWGCLVTC